MSRFMNWRSRTPLYEEAVTAITKLVELNGLDTAERAVAEALSDSLLAVYVEKAGFRFSRSSSPCIARLIDPGRPCPHANYQYSGQLPHAPPVLDHPSLLLKDGRPAAYVMHLYSLSWKDMWNLAQFCSNWGLRFDIYRPSWYFPLKATCIWIEREFNEEKTGNSPIKREVVRAAGCASPVSAQKPWCRAGRQTS